MANDALFIGWGAGARGREQQALRVFQETIGYWTAAQQEGRVESFEPFLLEPHGGGLAGFIIVRGQRAQLDALRTSEEHQRLIVRAAAIVDDVGVLNAFGDEALARQLGYFEQAAADLG